MKSYKIKIKNRETNETKTNYVEFLTFQEAIASAYNMTSRLGFKWEIVGVSKMLES